MNLNSYLNKAKTQKADEFYTSMKDIETELSYYRDCFKNKIVYCNADNPETSNFFRYFVDNFHELGLKKIFCSYYSRFRFTEDGGIYPPPYATRVKNVLGKLDSVSVALKGDGDFRSDECIEILKMSDIVVSNPPFSLFREYFAQLIENNKKFLILGNHNAISYARVFPYLRSNQVWLGVNNGGHKRFQVPNSYNIAKGAKIENGKKYTTLNNVVWFTNLDHPARYRETELLDNYKIEEYAKYDNYDAIEVPKINMIPNKYAGVMGVPLTFMYRYNPAQFQIVGFRKGNDGKDLRINGKSMYSRILIQGRSV